MRRTKNRFLYGMGLILAFGALALTTLPASANTGKCARKWVSNIHRPCANPGANCGGNCTCKDVHGNIWSDCYCLKPGVTGGGDETCDSSGKWEVTKTAGAVAANSTATFEFTGSYGDMLEIFSAADISNSGAVLVSQILNGEEDVTGSFTLSFGKSVVADPVGVPKAGISVINAAATIPVYFTALNMQVSSVQLLGLSTGTNTAVLGPGASTVAGTYNPKTGTIQFDTAVPCIGSNSLFPGGLAFGMRPILSATSFADKYSASMTSAIDLPDDVLTTDGLNLDK